MTVQDMLLVLAVLVVVGVLIADSLRHGDW